MGGGGGEGEEKGKRRGREGEEKGKRRATFYNNTSICTYTVRTVVAWLKTWRVG
jgi:hypothetical protein